MQIQETSTWGEMGIRVIGLATREFQKKAVYKKADERELVFEGFLLLNDPPLADARQTIADLREHGVDVKVITGDNRYVTQAMAVAVGLTTPKALTGFEIQSMSESELAAAVEAHQLFAEVDPQQKHQIVAALNKQGHIVGYMGDGINDAPALKEADVGISVENAVDVAKEAADVILQRHDLQLVHQGLVIGRATFANTLKYVYITTSANFGNMISMAIASLFLPFLPLLAKQILLNNFLSDFPALAIGTDNIDSEWKKKPHRWNLKDVKKYMISFGLMSSAFDLLTFLVLFYVLKSSPEVFRTGWFVESLLTEILIIFVVRTRGPFYKSRPNTALILLALIVSVTAIA
jgi:Mg2+-importing ATPase